MRKVLAIAGTRPEIIKLAPIILGARNGHPLPLQVELCLTGQHQTMANEAMSIFQIEERYKLNIMMPNQSLNDISKAIFERLPSILESARPDVVMVQGDTTSAAVAAICAFNMRIPVAHVEAGLRSFDLNAPFPEEMNRKIISSFAAYSFCPTLIAQNNLISESVAKETISVTGNTIVDALNIIADKHSLNGLEEINPAIRPPFVLVTAHRRESFGVGIRNICDALKTCAERYPQYQFVYPVHLTPNIQTPVQEKLSKVSNFILLPPVSYLSILTLLKHCEFAISDSGGIQEESPSFHKYCIVMREVTERTESVQLGLSELVGTDREKIISAFSNRVESGKLYAQGTNPYGDGNAAVRILEQLSGAGEAT
jgi:UDP-N-acetylglucosamine 2-epimerase (non-hydrolysing)